MFPDRVSNPGPLTYESGALPNALRGPAQTRLSAGVCDAHSAIPSFKFCISVQI